jgi:hypothetical protein
VARVRNPVQQASCRERARPTADPSFSREDLFGQRARFQGGQDPSFIRRGQDPSFIPRRARSKLSSERASFSRVQPENKSSPYSVASKAVTVAREAVTVGRKRHIAVLGELLKYSGQRPTFTRGQPQEFQRTESACKLTHTQTLMRSE